MNMQFNSGTGNSIGPWFHNQTNGPWSINQQGPHVQNTHWENQHNAMNWSFNQGNGHQFQAHHGYNFQNGGQLQGQPFTGQRGYRPNWSDNPQNFHNHQHQNNIPVEIRHEIKIRNQLRDAANISRNPADKHALQMQQKKVTLLLRQAGIVNKPKKEKAEKPKPFNCDCCDRGFATDEKLKEHIAQHVTCNIDGCKFTGHPKIVEKHYEMQHLTGLASAISRLNTPEEVEKWRQERKKNFPTALNAAKKQKLQEEKNLRGEVIKEKNFGKIYNNNRRGHRGRGNPRFQRGNNFSYRQAAFCSNRQNFGEVQNVPKEVEEGEIVDDDDKITPNSGSGNFFQVGEDSTPESEGEEVKPTVSSANTSLGGALGSLMLAYGTESDDEETEPKPAVKPETCSSKNVPNTNSNKSLKQELQVEKFRAHRENIPTEQFRKRPFQLLEKLLSKEICHERNMIMQCVRYIVKNNFFDKVVAEKTVKVPVAVGDAGYCSDSEFK